MILKINSSDGSIIWQKTLGGTGDERINSIIELNDGSLGAAGFSTSNDGDIKSQYGDGDAWVAKINSSDGSIIWQNSLGGSKKDEAVSIVELSDGALGVAGNTLSKEIEGYHWWR